MSTNIPYARHLLRSAQRVSSLRVKDLLITNALSIMTRKIKKKPAAAESEKMTTEKVNEIRDLLDRFPDYSYHRLGIMAGVIGARVCDVYRKHRTPESPGMPGDGMSTEIREAMEGKNDHWN